MYETHWHTTTKLLGTRQRLDVASTCPIKSISKGNTFPTSGSLCISFFCPHCQYSMTRAHLRQLRRRDRGSGWVEGMLKARSHHQRPRIGRWRVLPRSHPNGHRQFSHPCSDAGFVEHSVSRNKICVAQKWKWLLQSKPLGVFRSDFLKQLIGFVMYIERGVRIDLLTSMAHRIVIRWRAWTYLSNIWNNEWKGGRLTYNMQRTNLLSEFSLTSCSKTERKRFRTGLSWAYSSEGADIGFATIWNACRLTN